jgi:hypothetical protein
LLGRHRSSATTAIRLVRPDIVFTVKPRASPSLLDLSSEFGDPA